MTNKNLINAWVKFLTEELQCYADQNGNRPCDNGVVCDRCMTDKVKKEFLRKLENNQK